MKTIMSEELGVWQVDYKLLTVTLLVYVILKEDERILQNRKKVVAFFHECTVIYRL